MKHKPIQVGKTEYLRVYEFKNVTGKAPNFFKAKLSRREGDKMVHLGYVIGKTAKECALKMDIKLIELGMQPINILKKK